MSDDNGHHGEKVIEEIRSLVIPPGWARASVGEVGDVRLGRQRSPKNRSAEFPTKYVRAANITWNGLDLSDVLDMDFRPSELASYRLQPGDVLLSEASGSAGEVGKPAIWNGELEDCCFQNTVIRFRPKVVSSKFALVAFLHFARNSVFARVSKGVGIHHLSADRFASMPFLLPPKDEQSRIVAKIEELFSDLDAGVAALKRAKANLKRYRASVLKAAVEGKLTEEWRARHPATEPASALLARILKERRQKWEADQLAKFAAANKEPPKNWREKYVEPTPTDTTGLPVLPDGWCWATIQQLAFVDVGFAFKSAEYTKEGIRLLRGENMEPGSLRWNDLRFWPADKLAGLEHLLVKEGQIILAMDRPLVSAGLKLARVKACDLPCLLVQRMARLRMFDDAMTGFLHCSMQTHAFISHLLGDQTGTQLPHISGSGIEEFVTPLPPLMEQQQIATEVAEKLSQIEAAETGIVNSLLRASRLRQCVLKQAFEGKLVQQDPTDEPASVLLERLRASRSTHEGSGKSTASVRSRGRRAKSKQASPPGEEAER
jgi:type I restriction enzyme S subunit